MLNKYITIVIAASLTQGALAMDSKTQIKDSLKNQASIAEAHKLYHDQMQHVYSNVRPECQVFAVKYLRAVRDFKVGALTGYLLTDNLSHKEKTSMKDGLLKEVNQFCLNELLEQINK